MKATLVLLLGFQLTSTWVFADDSDENSIFENAGQNYGTQVWKVDVDAIEDQVLVPLSKTEAAAGFSTNDVYIVLQTTQLMETVGWNIHYWIGLQVLNSISKPVNIAETDLNGLWDHVFEAQPKVEKLFEFVINLHMKLNNEAVCHREVEEHESSLFKSYFPKVYSPNTHDLKEPTQLYLVKGAHRIRVVQVPLGANSLSDHNCYVLYRGQLDDLFVYLGNDQTSIQEKSYTLSVANIFGVERKIGIRSWTDDTDNTRNFFNALMHSSNEECKAREFNVPADTSLQFEERRDNDIQLFKIRKVYGSTQSKEIMARPYFRDIEDARKEKRCSLINTASEAGLLIILGKLTDLEEQKSTFGAAEGYILKKGLDLWTTVAVASYDDMLLYP